ncbi:hypothetical protein E5676_scaffold1085G00070 [Cucumis melo var. makuwa]|uniref:Uncharacterized protein n=1 Tax=Cucumis melo var. makuwa TaxID=1194695 RepID=A0A5A7T571_CUCMM|nr:hypothetical protein E6C27_scaffold68G00210 [Cucumis melo var. makuwa]TYK05897.1 hypothetical protein E5676_scaffold1085G00070 [Cucumis melo var. makuwa]
MASNSQEWRDDGFGSRNDSQRNRENRGRLDGIGRNPMVALQGQVTEMNKLLQSMALLQVNVAGSFVQACNKMSSTPICTTWGVETIHILVKGVKSKMFNTDKVAKEITRAKHLVNAKNSTMRGHASQHNVATTTTI